MSEGVGAAPIWSSDGEEIYFVGPPPGPLMSVSVEVTPATIIPRRPQELFRYEGPFRIPAFGTTPAPYDILPNGDGIVAVQLAGLTQFQDAQVSAARSRINVVLNWFEELERLVPTE